jgi:hypothetical protein
VEGEAGASACAVADEASGCVPLLLLLLLLVAVLVGEVDTAATGGWDTSAGNPTCKGHAAHHAWVLAKVEETTGFNRH